MLTLKPFPTQSAFIDSTADISVIIGPQGEGKTWSGLVKALKRYNENGGVKGVLIRDSLKNILTKTVPSINEALAPSGVSCKVRNNELLTIPGYPGFSFELVGVQDLGGLNRLQGGGWSDVWLEEGAPVHEEGATASLGVPLQAFLTALSRAGRVGGKPAFYVTMNPGSEDHWTYTVFIDRPLPGVTTEVFCIPYNENKSLSDNSRRLTLAAFSMDVMKAYSERYIHGRFSYVPLGAPVAKAYNAKYHRSGVDFEPMKGVQCIRGWDGGLNPSCVFLQITPAGRVIIIDTFRGDNIGMKQFLTHFIGPVVKQRYDKVKSWIDVGDPSMANREQSDSDYSAANIIEQGLGTMFNQGAVLWPPRREAINETLSRFADGEPMLQLSKHEKLLHYALRGGWHYSTSVAGQIRGGQAAIPVKNIHSHPADALSYALEKMVSSRPKVKRSVTMNNRALDRFRDTITGL